MSRAQALGRASGDVDASTALVGREQERLDRGGDGVHRLRVEVEPAVLQDVGHGAAARAGHGEGRCHAFEQHVGHVLAARREDDPVGLVVGGVDLREGEPAAVADDRAAWIERAQQGLERGHPGRIAVADEVDGDREAGTQSHDRARHGFMVLVGLDGRDIDEPERPLIGVRADGELLPGGAAEARVEPVRDDGDSLRCPVQLRQDRVARIAGEEDHPVRVGEGAGLTAAQQLEPQPGDARVAGPLARLEGEHVAGHRHHRVDPARDHPAWSEEDRSTRLQPLRQHPPLPEEPLGQRSIQ